MSEIFKIFWFMLLACKENVNYFDLGNRYAVKLKKLKKKNSLQFLLFLWRESQTARSFACQTLVWFQYLFNSLMKLWIKTYIIFINKECKQWFFFYLHTSKIQSDSSKNPFKLVFLTLRVERGWPDGQEFLEKIFPRKKSWGACGVEPKLPPMFGSRSFPLFPSVF